jgi:hypothetical protein
LIITIIEHPKTKSKQKIVRDPFQDPPLKKARFEIAYPTPASLWSIRKFGSARKIGYSEPERSRRLQKKILKLKEHVKQQAVPRQPLPCLRKRQRGNQ